MSHNVIEGTWEEIERHKAELIGRRLRVTIKPKSSSGASASIASKKRPSALGKYAFVSGGSEEFATSKLAEIEREDRKRP
jgi:hypothetical protein